MSPQTVRSSVPRGYVTAWLISNLSALGNPVGDGNVPSSGSWGWQGQPNDTGAFFIPWLSVMPGTGRVNPTSSGIGSFSDAGSEQILGYSVTFNAVNRQEVEWLADSTRKDMVNQARSNLDCGAFGHWTIVQVRSVTIGGILRVRTTDPDYYVQTDTFDIWVSKEH